MSIVESSKRLVTGKPVFRKPSLAVEIGSEWVKIAQSKFGLAGASLVRLSCRPLAAGAETEALVQALTEAGCKARGVTLCLPRNQITIRMLRVPATDPDEISKIVHLQAGRLTPYSSDEVVSAFNILGADNQGYSTVMLAIARRRLISERMDIVAKAGGSVESVGVGTEGVCNQIAQTMGSDFTGTTPNVVLNVDADFSELLIFYRGSLRFSKSILIGATSLADDISHWQGELINEIVTGVDQFKQENDGDVEVKEVFILGIPQMPSLVAALEEVCGFKTHFADVLTGRRRNRRVKPGESSVAAVVGCSLNPERPGIDLLPPEMRLGKVLARRRNQLNLMGLLGLFIVTMLLALLVTNYYERRLYVAGLQDLVDAQRPVAEATERWKERIDHVHSRLSADGAPINLLAELHRLTPDEIYLTSVRISARDQLELRGRAFAMSHVFEYVKTLEGSHLFEDADPAYTKVTKINREEFAEFTITCQFQAPPTQTPRRPQL